MTYTPKQLDELKRSIPTWKILADRGYSYKKEGKDYVFSCPNPAHTDRTPSFRCTPKDGVWLYNCLGCHVAGNIFQLIQLLDNISFQEAVDKLHTEYNWQKGKEEVESSFSPMGEQKSFLTFPLANLRQAEAELEQRMEWLSSRGITLETARRFHLGYVQSVAAVNPYHEFVNDGWIIFPTIKGDQITSLKYRSIKEKRFIRKNNMAVGLYNLETISPSEDIFIVEGEVDCMTMEQAGYRSVSLPSATFTLTPEMRDLVMKAGAIFLAGDMDSVGDATMVKLWLELRDRTYRIKWPVGCKDANEFFLKNCKGDIKLFKDELEKLKHRALEQPIPYVYDLKETLHQSDSTHPMDNPARLRFPWPNIDSWTAIVPGDLMFLSASDSGAGKTSWLQAVLLENALKHDKVIVNYSAELQPDQYARRVAAYLTGTNREQLTKENFIYASNQLESAKFYNGYKPGAGYKDVIELLKWAKRRLGADILAVDHLHFLTRGEKDEIKAQSEAMRMLKDFAFEYKVIVIVVGQPRKQGSNQRGREAITPDLKGSESCGSDSSQVFILHRDRVTGGSDDSPLFDPVTKVKLDKSRESETRMTKLFFRGDICTFHLMDKEQTMEANDGQ